MLRNCVLRNNRHQAYIISFDSTLQTHSILCQLYFFLSSAATHFLGTTGLTWFDLVRPALLFLYLVNFDKNWKWCWIKIQNFIWNKNFDFRHEKRACPLRRTRQARPESPLKKVQSGFKLNLKKLGMIHFQNFHMLPLLMN